MVTATVQNQSLSSGEGLRPVNLRTDLAPLADLIELAFSETMDSGGRAAVREMRQISRMGIGLNVISNINDLTSGISMGYVWLVDGRLVGNVSVYPTSWPQEYGSAWIIANVAVHPDYRGQGIARRLMQASIEMIQDRGGAVAVLQVDEKNEVAQRIYQQLGFRVERGWTSWRRGPGARMSASSNDLDTLPVLISRRQRGEWQAEYALASQIRAAEQGGLGWLKPLHPNLFHSTVTRRVMDWFSFRNLERLVIRGDDGHSLRASLWIDNGFAMPSAQLHLLVDPAYQGAYDEILLQYIIRRLGSRTALTIEHPTDEVLTSAALRHNNFRPLAARLNMIWHNPSLTK